jgi:hypothetical protein
VEKVQWVGTTWYERGLAYWARRSALTVFAAAILALFTAILVLFLQGVYRSSGRHAWFYGLLRSLSAVLPPERQARQRMAERLRARGYDVSVS